MSTRHDTATSVQPCGCARQPCSCCGGVARETPATVCNRPGLPALVYRVGTHGRFYRSMQARLSSIEVDGVEPDGQTQRSWRPLDGLTTRDAGDFSLALLDGWASVGDVLTFYQERIANEGYLGTATERRSVLELARLVGYAPRPGVAASVYLAYTLDDNQADPVTIPAGARSQSVPGPDERPQFFETSEDLFARREWNAMPPRLTRPPQITLDNVLLLESLHVAGVATGLRAGDKLLFVFSEDAQLAAVRTVERVDTEFADQRSAVRLQPLEKRLRASVVLLLVFIAEVKAMSAAVQGRVEAIARAERLLADVRLAKGIAPVHWAPNIRDSADPEEDGVLDLRIDQLDAAIDTLYASAGNSPLPHTDPETFVADLLVKGKVQPRNSASLTRSLAGAFATPAALGQLLQAPQPFGQDGNTQGTTPPSFVEYADPGTQLLLNFAPVLQTSYYQAWAGAALNPKPAPLHAVYALRARATLFGATASKLATYFGNNDGFPPGTLKPQNDWDDWRYAADETTANAWLDQANDNVVAGGYVLVHDAFDKRVLRIDAVSTRARTAYGQSGSSTELELRTPDDTPWRSVVEGNEQTRAEIGPLRTTQLWLQSEALTLVPTPVTEPVAGREVQLGGVYKELLSGRWVVVSGERADIAHVDGVRSSELMMLTAVRHGYDPELPGDSAHTTLTFATNLAYAYRRGTVALNANVVRATHGASVDEVLGSGDGAATLARFALKQPPLTFVSAPTAAGAATTLKVLVDKVEWAEAPSLASLGPNDRGYVTRTDDSGVTSVIFGNGVNGRRPPTGVQNLHAEYRSGIGAAGNVRPEQISLLQTRQLGVKGVINPQRSSGGADRETRDLARENAPLSVLALDRLVSVQDYADFTRTFAGIAKATAVRASDGRRQLVYLTIAGVADAPIDETSDLYRNLVLALRTLGDADLPLEVEPRELIALVLSVNIEIDPRHRWEPVGAAVRARLLDTFGFDRRALGQDALRCEIAAAIQAVPGVVYVDIDAFGGVPEKSLRLNRDGVPERQVLSQAEIANHVFAIARGKVAPPFAQAGIGGLFVSDDDEATGWRDGVVAFGGGVDRDGRLRPAQLAVFVPGVPDTLTLNQRIVTSRKRTS